MIGSKILVCGAVSSLSALAVVAVVPLVENVVDRPDRAVPATNRAVAAANRAVAVTNHVETSASVSNAVAANRRPSRKLRPPEEKSTFTIDEIAFTGETNLVRLAEVGQLVRELLCDGFPKTDRDIRASLDYATVELAAAGYGTGTLAYRGAAWFDPAARRLTVTVRRGHLAPGQRFQNRPDRVRVAKETANDTPVASTAASQASGGGTSSVNRVAFEVRERGQKGAPAPSTAASAPLAGLASVDPQKRVSGPLVQSVEAARKARAEERPPEIPIVEEVRVNALPDGARLGVVRSIVLSGPSAFIEDEGVLRLLEHPLCDGCVKTVGDVRRALAAARAELVGRGFLLVSLVPVSERSYHADTQTLDIAVRPGTYGGVEVTMKGGDGAGNWHGSRQVERYFKDLKPGEVFNYNDFRHALGRLNANPDFVADATVAVSVPSGTEDAAEAGRTADLKLEVDDSFPLHGSLQFDNYAMEELGYWQTALLVRYLNLTGAGDALSVSPAMTLSGEMWSVAGSYVRPFEWLWGGSLSAAGGYSRLATDDVSPRLDLVGAGAYAGLGLSINLWDTDRRNLALDLGLQWRYLDDVWSIPDYDIPGRSLHILPLTFGLSYADRRRDGLGGLDFLNAGETVNLCHGGDFDSFVEDGQPHYWIFRGSWSRLQPLVGPGADGEEWRCWSLFSRLEGQYSAQDLLTAEKLALGGHSALRGYRTRGYIGDNGIYGTVEFRTPVFCDPITSLFRLDEGQPAIERFQFHAFSDLGGVAFNDAPEGFERSEFLWSAGLGLRMGLTRFFSLNLDLAFPLHKAYLEEMDRNMELYLSVKGQY